MHALTSLTILALVHMVTASSKDTGCHTFGPTPNNMYVSYYRNYDPIRISKGLTCNSTLATKSNSTCPLPSWAYLSYGAHWNITLPPDDKTGRIRTYLAVAAVVGIPFERLALGNITAAVMNRTYELHQGQSAYVQFSELFSCTVGVFGGCDGTDWEGLNGVTVEACYPTYQNATGNAEFYDKSRLVFVDAETAGNMTDHPHAQPVPSANDDLVVENPHGSVNNIASVVSSAMLLYGAVVG